MKKYSIFHLVFLTPILTTVFTHGSDSFIIPSSQSMQETYFFIPEHITRQLQEKDAEIAYLRWELEQGAYNYIAMLHIRTQRKDYELYKVKKKLTELTHASTIANLLQQKEQETNEKYVSALTKIELLEQENEKLKQSSDSTKLSLPSPTNQEKCT